mgnify:CR=1 FL=1
MTDNASKRRALQRLVRIAPAVRGLLAEATGDQDVPYRPVILKSLTSDEAIHFANSAGKSGTVSCPAPLAGSRTPPLFLGPVDCAAASEETREQLRDAIGAYAQQHGAKPEIVCLRDLGALYAAPSERPAERSLWNKVALVTGAAGAIGYGICRGLLEKGCYVVASDLPGERLDRLAADLKRISSERVVGVPIDVTDKESVDRGIEDVNLTWGGIDILVLNAGIAMVAHLKEMELEAFRRLEKVNIEGALLTLSAIARHFILQGIGGDIIVISTKNVPSPGAGFGAYSATKAACHQLGRIASIELAAHGVRVNMVAPDGVFSEGQYKSGLWEEVGPDRMRARGLDEQGLQEYYRNRNLLKARITGQHVANAVLFFATRQTPTTGATIPVDGGLPDATPR